MVRKYKTLDVFDINQNRLDEIHRIQTLLTRLNMTKVMKDVVEYPIKKEAVRIQKEQDEREKQRLKEIVTQNKILEQQKRDAFRDIAAQYANDIETLDVICYNGNMKSVRYFGSCSEFFVDLSTAPAVRRYFIDACIRKQSKLTLLQISGSLLCPNCNNCAEDFAERSKDNSFYRAFRREISSCQVLGKYTGDDDF